MLEKDFQREFHKWCKHNWFESSVFELKVSQKGQDDYISFSAVKPHQEEALLRTSGEGLFYKISDFDQISRKPFDCFYLNKGTTAFVVLWFASDSKAFYLIPIHLWVTEKEGSKRASLTLQRAKEIGMRMQIGILRVKTDDC